MIPRVKKFLVENDGLIDFQKVNCKNELPKRVADELFGMCKRDENGVCVSFDIKSGESEAYSVEITDTGVKICAESEAGAFYALQTIKQLMKENDGKLPYCNIEDAPDLKVRGFYHDISRGRVQTLDELKKIIDKLAELKYNMLQLYVEAAFDFKEYDGITAKDNMLTAEEVKELDRYCESKYIELIPSLSTFGHLYDLLQSEKYKHLCELENYEPKEHYWLERMAHHTIDASNEESIQLIYSLIDQYAALFKSDKFNICCDETFDLCKGRNKGKDAGETYFEFVNKIVSHLNKMGKKVQMWADIAIAHSDKISMLDGELTLLNWDYAPEPSEEKIKRLHDAGLKQILCPAIHSWNRFIANVDLGGNNVSNMACFAKKYNADGMLTTSWGDYGHIQPWEGCLYMVMFAAERSWNVSCEPVDDEFDKNASLLGYDVKENIIPHLNNIYKSEEDVWTKLLVGYSLIVMKHETFEMPSDESLANTISVCEKEAKELGKFEQNDKVKVLINAAEGTKIAAVCCQKLKGAKIEKGFWKPWFEEYSKLWLKESKYSGLGEIKNILELVDAL